MAILVDCKNSLIFALFRQIWAVFEPKAWNMFENEWD